MKCQVAVVGSGPGGSIAACLLAEAGLDVLLIEEGPFLTLDSCEPYTIQEMFQKYRNGGQTVALGSPKIAYAEGCCVGGGSEINSGLYHRTPPEILELWRKVFHVEALQEKDLEPHFIQCEKDVSVSYLPEKALKASLKLEEGAHRLGWKAMEVPRWIRYTDDKTSSRKQSMTETFIPRFLKAEGKLLPETRVERINQTGRGWELKGRHKKIGLIQISVEKLFLACGAINTSALLQKSGIHRNMGSTLRLHPTIKVIALFAEGVNEAKMGVPVHQVKEFHPRFSFGCSVSSPEYIALGMLDHRKHLKAVLKKWRHAAIYYSMITGQGRGRIRVFPGFKSPMVQYRLTPDDLRDVLEGLRRLCFLLFEAGAIALYPGIHRGPVLKSVKDLSRLPGMADRKQTSLMSVHLFSSCPMGENRKICATDSFGRVQGFKDLFIADASLLCTAPGVNPQGSIMAIVRRNTLRFLNRL